MYLFTYSLLLKFNYLGLYINIYNNACNMHNDSRGY